MADRWLPNIEQFFSSLYQCICNAQQQVEIGENGDLYYWLRRIQNYEPSLNAIVTRYQRLHGAESRLVQNLLTLQQFLTSTSRQLEGLSSHSLHENPLSSGETLTTATCSTGAAGRPRLSLNMEDISNFRSLGFSWSNISSLYGVSSRTLRRRRQESCVDVQSYDSITDADLDNIVGEILETTPQAGRNLVRGSLQSRGVHVQRRRIVEAIERVDPVTPTLRDNRQIVRRRYNVPCPNFLWHIDGDHKLINPYRFVLHGGIDGYTRLIVYLKASTNNKASTVLQLFQEAVAHYNLPSRVRCDFGLENVDVGRLMLETRGVNRGSILTGPSVRNQRIERLWREVNRVIVSRFLDIFLYLESNGYFDPDNEVHLLALHRVYLPLINSAIEEFVRQWNNHPLTSEFYYSPLQLWVRDILTLRNSGYSAVDSVISGEQILENYGVEDHDEDTAEIETSNVVVVPDSPITLDDSAEEVLQELSQQNATDDSNGISRYIRVMSHLVNVVQ